MSTINRAGFGIILMALLVMIGTGLGVEPAIHAFLSLTALIGFFILVIPDRE